MSIQEFHTKLNAAGGATELMGTLHRLSMFEDAAALRVAAEADWGVWNTGGGAPGL